MEFRHTSSAVENDFMITTTLGSTKVILGQLLLAGMGVGDE